MLWLSIMASNTQINHRHCVIQTLRLGIRGVYTTMLVRVNTTRLSVFFFFKIRVNITRFSLVFFFKINYNALK